MRAFLWAVVLGTGVLSVAGEQVLRSGERAVPLIELFTSEGCSSCPPAERWLGTLRDDPGLWQDFVPIAWHVNYWDRLGWPDKFAEAAYTERQYAYAKSWSSSRVYTPGFVRGGAEWRPTNGDLSAAKNAKPAGNLIATVKGDQVTVQFTSVANVTNRDRLMWVNVVRLGGGIVSDVRQGENRGKQLEHEFLVLGWERVELREGSAVVSLPPTRDDVPLKREALAIWVSDANSPAPIQATGGWLD